MTQSQRDAANRDLTIELKALQEALKESWIDHALPDDWQGLDSGAPISRAKTRVTVRLDADMVRWFRKLGPGYGARINQILRIYWLGLAAGKIRSHWASEDHLPRFQAYMDERIAAQRARSAARRAALGLEEPLGGAAPSDESSPEGGPKSSPNSG